MSILNEKDNSYNFPSLRSSYHCDKSTVMTMTASLEFANIFSCLMNEDMPLDDEEECNKDDKIGCENDGDGDEIGDNDYVDQMYHTQSPPARSPVIIKARSPRSNITAGTVQSGADGKFERKYLSMRVSDSYCNNKDSAILTKWETIGVGLKVDEVKRLMEEKEEAQAAGYNNDEIPLTKKFRLYVEDNQPKDENDLHVLLGWRKLAYSTLHICANVVQSQHTDEDNEVTINLGSDGNTST